jgi:hypothetical protein
MAKDLGCEIRRRTSLKTSNVPKETSLQNRQRDPLQNNVPICTMFLVNLLVHAYAVSTVHRIHKYLTKGYINAWAGTKRTEWLTRFRHFDKDFVIVDCVVQALENILKRRMERSHLLELDGDRRRPRGHVEEQRICYQT